MLFKKFDYYIMRPPNRVRLMCLDVIKQVDGKELVEDRSDTEIIQSKISETNWNGEEPDNHSTVVMKHFFYQELLPFYAKHLEKRHRKNFEVIKVWYQIYKARSGSYHNWHNHIPGSNISNIWYLKLPNGCGTEFKVNGKTIKPRVREGDLLVFPSDVIHRSPENYSDEDKVIVSYNTIWSQ